MHYRKDKYLVKYTLFISMHTRKESKIMDAIRKGLTNALNEMRSETLTNAARKSRELGGALNRRRAREFEKYRDSKERFDIYKADAQRRLSKNIQDGTPKKNIMGDVAQLRDGNVDNGTMAIAVGFADWLGVTVDELVDMKPRELVFKVLEKFKPYIDKV